MDSAEEILRQHSNNIKKFVRIWKSLLTTKDLKADILAGISVACIALPLSLAIALASSVSPTAGIISAIVGGIACALFGGTPLAISGPAAAMSILVASVVQKFGVASLIIVVIECGILQIVSGLSGVGRFIRYVPTPVISGFTPGIGAIILIGQLPRALGLPAPPQAQISSVLTHLSHYLTQANKAATLLALATLALNFTLIKISKKIPAALVAVVLTTVIATLFHLPTEKIQNIPTTLPYPQLPLWPAANLSDLLQSGFVFFLLASLASLLSSTAVDKLSGKERHDPNQELIGQGIGNILCGFFGGMPITGEVVRSSLNVSVGAATRRASIIHSLTLIAMVVFFSSWIQLIPIPVLAGILLVVAFRMLNPMELIYLWRVSRAEAGVYLLTFSVIVFTGLVAGIQAGIIASMIILAIRLGSTRSHFHASENQGPYRFIIQGAMTFISAEKLQTLRNEMDRMNYSRGIILDLSKVGVLDASGAREIVEIVTQLMARGARVTLYQLSTPHQQFLCNADPSGVIKDLFSTTDADVDRVLRKEMSKQSIDRLISGVESFQNHSRHRYQNLFNRLAESQAPHTLFMTCSDSRINPNLITSTDPGELFIVRNVGNMFPSIGNDDTPAEAAAVEFAVQVLGVTEVVVCGHSGCGAMKAIVQKQNLSHLPNLTRWLQETNDVIKTLPPETTLDEAAKLNSLMQLDHLRKYPGILDKVRKGELRLHAWFYHIGSGEIEAYSDQSQKFVPIGQQSNPKS